MGVVMTRDELAEMIIDALLPDISHETVVEGVVLSGALWPVLARCWNEGWDAGSEDTRAAIHGRRSGDTSFLSPNPYGEAPDE